MGRDYIIFFKRSGNKLFSRLGDFGHVFILSLDNNDIWVGIDPCENGVAICTIENIRVDDMKKVFTYIELKNYNAYNFQLGLPMLRSCVGLVKAMLGIRNPFIWTPKQLYKHLIRMK